MIPKAINEIWLCEFLWSETLEYSSIYVEAKELANDINRKVAVVKQLRSEKITLVGTDLLSRDILEIIFGYTEIFVNFSKVDSINELIVKVLDQEELHSSQLYEAENISILSQDSLPECGRVEDSAPTINLEISAVSQSKKRSFTQTESKMSPQLKKQRLDSDVEHKHDKSC